MRRLIIIVEGQTEEEFINLVVAPYLKTASNVLDVRSIKIATGASCKGGFVDYKHLKNDILKRIHESDVIISMFVDYFGIPNNIPDYSSCMKQSGIDDKIRCLEDAIRDDVGYCNFIPYIQKHEFEALLFSSNIGFTGYFDEKIFNETQKIINQYPDPEEINGNSDTAPSKRIKAIIRNYNKVVWGNIIALEVGIDRIMEKCQHFRSWINSLIKELNRD